MEYYVKSIIPILKMNYDKFTPLEKTIADFFISNREKVDLSSKAMAERLYISEASLSRFAKKCGYHGYREFVYQYESTFVEDRHTMTGGTRMILNAYQELLNKTYSMVDELQIDRITRFMDDAQRVIVSGCGSSGQAAAEMEMRFMRIGVDINAIQDGDLMRMRAMIQDAHSLVIGISVSGETESVLYLLRESHQRNAKTVLITAERNDTFSEFCDEILYMPSLRYLNQGNLISPQFPILVMSDILYVHYSARDKNKKNSLHDDTLRALNAGKRRKHIAD